MNDEAPTLRPGEMGRILILLLIVVAAGLWLGHHLGLEIVNPIVAVGAAVATFTGAVMTVASLFGYKLDEWVQPALRRTLGPVAIPPLLWTAGPALVLLMALFSSVTIVAEDDDQGIQVSVVPLDSAGSPRQRSLAPGEPMARFGPVLTNPFGRLYRVEVAGYVPAAFPVYPLVGRRVVLGTDLSPVPSVLFRPFVRGLGALADGGVFRVSRVRPAGLEPLVSETGQAAFRLGRWQPATAAMIEFWGLQLDIAEAPPPARAQMLIWWSTPRQLSSPVRLAPNDSLMAEIVHRDIVVARAGVRLGRERLMDVAVVDVRH